MIASKNGWFDITMYRCHLIGVDIIIVSNKLGYTVLYTYVNLYLSV